MFATLPKNALQMMDWSWRQLLPFFEELADRSINTSNVESWLADWTRIDELLFEMRNRLYIATTIDTTDRAAEELHNKFLDEIYPKAREADQKLKEKLVKSGLEPAGFEFSLRKMRAEAEIFRQANLPLLSQELKLANQYDKIVGAQTVTWEGEEFTLERLKPLFQNPDRGKRQRAWQAAADRQLEDRGAINHLWVKFMELRGKIAVNAGFVDYRAYRWLQMHRFDYSPEDCTQFHKAIEDVAIPAAKRVYEKHRRKLGVESLRPWDLNVDPNGFPPLRPYRTIDELENKTELIFRKVDPKLGEYFAIMRSEGLLDLENRQGKAPGGYCEDFPAERRPFIFMNAVGVHDDVQTILHEGGHAFHVFEIAHLPYLQQRYVGLEFAEVASMAMELLSAPYLTADQGGFYTPKEAARARIEHLEDAICFWPYMAVVDSFQHWVYENHRAASDPANCDAAWHQLWERFMHGVDWSGLEDEMVTGWQRKLHIHQDPFYYIEYGLAMLGAIQVWRHALEDQAAAVAAYRGALSLGGTIPLPELYAAAGARLAFDEDTLGEAIQLVEKTIESLESVD